MNEIKTLKEEFLPLAKRLLFYVSGEYLNTPENKYIHDEDDPEFEYEEMIKNIVLRTNLYTSDEVFLEAKKYAKQVKEIEERLIPKTKELSFMGGEKIFTTEEQEKFLVECRMELSEYAYYLNVMQNNNFNKNIDTIAKAGPTFNLPEGFKVPELTKEFSPYLNAKTAALLLHYFTELKVTPTFTKENLAKLAKPLFAVSENTTRTQLVNIYDLIRDQEQVNKLKDLLQKLINALDKGLID